MTRPFSVGEEVMIVDPSSPWHLERGVVEKGEHAMTFAGVTDPVPYVVVAIHSAAGHRSGARVTTVRRLADVRAMLTGGGRTLRR